MKIVVDPYNLNPTIDGTRVTVLDIVNAVANDDPDFVSEHSVLQDHLIVAQAITFCTKRKCEERNSYCGGCALRTAYDGIETFEQFINRFAKVYVIDDDETVVIDGTGNEGTYSCLGSVAQLKEEWRGVRGWEMAQSIEADNRGE